MNIIYILYILDLCFFCINYYLNIETIQIIDYISINKYQLGAIVVNA